MAMKNNPLSDVFGFVQKAATDAVNATGSIAESVKDGIVSAANSVGSVVNDAANKVSNQTVKIADLNGDGKLDQEDSVKTPDRSRSRPKGTANKPAISEPKEGKRLPS